MTTRRAHNFNPPTLKELLKDPLYRQMFIRPIVQPGKNPWAVYALKNNGRWVGKVFPDYIQAFEMVKIIISQMNDAHYVDVSIVSRASLHSPPVKYMWQTSKFDWCGRCRRPTTFKRDQGLHALRGAVILTTDEAFRCFYCGMRKAGQPDYKPIRYTQAELDAMAKAGEEYDQPTRGRRTRSKTPQA